MGMPIEVKTGTAGDIAFFDTDRSLGGQDPESFTSATQARQHHTIPGRLATRLFDRIPGVTNVFIHSNQAVLRRPTGWSALDLEQVTDTIRQLFVYYGPDGQPPKLWRQLPASRIEALRQQHYNATIDEIRQITPGLWVMWVMPDQPVEHYRPGQYTTLALGYWESGSYHETEPIGTGQLEKLARRSMSVSSSILDARGNLVDPAADPRLEFYLALVAADPPSFYPPLTPRLFQKKAGDRIFMGTKFAGRYTLDGVQPDDDVILLATGTGEAPNNRMLLELLRQGHRGRVVNACCVRYRADLAYLDIHRRLERSFPNYQYIALTTREPENHERKRYIQDLIAEGEIETALGRALDPSRMHIFMCGNPAMIGLPTWEGEHPTFPTERGAAELFTAHGFVLNRPGVSGNLHYEEYW